MREERNHWAYRELEKKLREQTLDQPLLKIKELPEFGTLFLVDPKMRDDIDRTIRNELWPAVLKGLKGSGIRIYKQRDALTRIGKTRSPELSRRLGFLFEDPKRPIGSQRTSPWHISGTVEGRPFTYMLTFDLILDFPITFDLMVLTRLMRDPRLGGIPPELTVDTAREAREDRYNLKLSWGRGGRYGDPEYDPERLITNGIKKHLEIIGAMDQLESDFEMPELFQTLSRRIIAFYSD
jgi:hypothetical protein